MLALRPSNTFGDWRNLKMSNKASFEKINYILRPKKQIERKIIIEILQSLHKHCPNISIKNYQYIGMGSVFYYDFILFHKLLHINKMISIDTHPSVKRFEYNKPYDFIEFKKTSTSKFLEGMDYKESTIVWFDYDGKLYNEIAGEFKQTDILSDIREVINKAKPLDFFFVTVNAKLPNELRNQKSIIDLFSKYLPDEHKTDFLENEDNWPKFIQEIILNFISDVQKGLTTKFYKLVSFSYDDGTPMYTLGGIFDKSNENQTRLSQVKYVSFDKYIVDINVPLLTYKEKIYLDSNIETISKRIKSSRTLNDIKQIVGELETEVEPYSALEGYLEFYKYYPLYFEGHI